MSGLEEKLSPETRKAIDLAKRAVTKGGELDAPLLLAAVYHAGGLDRRLPELGAFLEKPKPLRKKPLAKAPVSKPLWPAIQKLAADPDSVTPEEFFLALLQTSPGRGFLLTAGLSESDLQRAAATISGRPDAEPEAEAELEVKIWRSSPERQKAIKALGSFGRTLTEAEVPFKGAVEMDAPLRRVTKVLIKMKRRNAIVHGPAGTGKSALIYELARRLAEDHPSIPPPLRGMDIFELSPTFLRSGASMVGQYEERVKALLQVLAAHPKIILFVDEIHSLFRSGMHHHGPFTEANEEFKAAMGKGEITCIGCTTTAEYRHYIAPDTALVRRFSTVKLAPPSRRATLRILEARKPRLEAHYAPLQVPPAMLAKAVDLTEEYVLGRFQPDKSIQLLDEACALCIMHEPPLAELDEEMLVDALEDSLGHSVIKREKVREEKVYEELSSKIIGQDETLRGITRAFVAGLGAWSRKAKGPRGSYFFCGPTGVGKTEVAVLLARILGGGREAMLRVDCNTLQGGGLDSGPVINRLLGPPPGYIGYVRGEGGLLSKIRDTPECVVLFDEIEKADPGLGKTLLQILDVGRIEDSDGNPLDFRRAFVIFTTNAGCVYDRKLLGFGEEGPAQVTTPTVDLEAVKAEMRRIGYGEEFLGRIDHYFAFAGLEGDAIRIIIGQRLGALQQTAELRGYDLTWREETVAYLAEHWQPRFGVRHLITMLRHRITEQLSVAEAQGELEGVKAISLQVLDLDELEEERRITGAATRERRGTTMIINLV